MLQNDNHKPSIVSYRINSDYATTQLLLTKHVSSIVNKLIDRGIIQIKSLEKRETNNRQGRTNLQNPIQRQNRSQRRILQRKIELVIGSQNYR